MPTHGCTRRCLLGAAGLLAGLVGFGCQSDVSNNIMQGNNPPGAMAYNRGYPAKPAGYGYDSGVVQAGYQAPAGAGDAYNPRPGPARIPSGQPTPPPPGPVPPGFGHDMNTPNGDCAAVEDHVPVELNKVSLPPYRVEPPDVLLIDTVRMIPRPPYRVEPMDIVLVQVAEPLANQPITGPYMVGPDGSINLGYTYGSVHVAGLSLEEAEAALRKHLTRVLKNPQVAVALGQFRGVQQARGEHLVRPDGTISMGTYGSVYIAGMTLDEAKFAIEQHLSRFVLNPEISIDVFAYNSKVYYVIADGAGFGQQVLRFPITGNETVLDAISNIAGLPAVASKRHIWVARPAPCGHPCDQILPVDWMAITQGGATCTNWQLFPGDRVYIKADPLICLDNTLAKIISPIERLFGITLLGTETVHAIQGNHNGSVVTGF